MQFFYGEITVQEKIQAVKKYLEGVEGHKPIARAIGVTPGVFMNWIRQYQYHGEKAVEKRYTTYTAEDKLEVLQYMNEHGTSHRETAAIFNIPAPSSLLQWEKQYETEGVDALNPKKKGRPLMEKKTKNETKKQLSAGGSVEALQAEVERLRMENAYLKKLMALVQSKENHQTRPSASSL